MADLNQFEMPRHSIKDQVELCTDTEYDSASPYSQLQSQILKDLDIDKVWFLSTRTEPWVSTRETSVPFRLQQRKPVLLSV